MVNIFISNPAFPLREVLKVESLLIENYWENITASTFLKMFYELNSQIVRQDYMILTVNLLMENI